MMLLLFFLSLSKITSADNALTPDYATKYDPGYFKDPPLNDLIVYYPQITDGLITPRLQPSDFQPESSLRVYPNYSLQDYFTIDIEEFLKREDRKDFLDSKIRFYKRQAFHEFSQSFDRPYHYISSWGPLFHPPIKNPKRPLEKYFHQYTDREPNAWSVSPYFSERFHTHLDSLSKTELTSNNKLNLFTNAEAFQKKIQLASQSEKYFFGMVMVYFCSSSTENFITTMGEKVKAGVDVRMILEGLYGSTVAKNCVKKMKRAGIKVLLIKNSLKLMSLTWVLHNKMWIRDGKEAMIGGQNIHQYETRSTGFNGLMRDTEVLVSGPAVTDMTREYLRLWKLYSKKRDPKTEEYETQLNITTQNERENKLRGPENYKAWFEDNEKKWSGVCRVLVQDFTKKHHPIAPILAEYIRGAQDQIQFTTPSLYYVKKKSKKKKWPRILADLIKEKATRDSVKIDIISNGADGGSGTLSAFLRKLSYYHETKEFFLLKAIIDTLDRSISNVGARHNRQYLIDISKNAPIRSWTYFQYIHAKQYFFDRIATMIGSVNFDSHSLEKNHESAIICQDKQLAQQMEIQFTMDLINSVPVF